MPDVGGLFSWFRSSEANFPPLTEGFPHQRVERTPLPKALPPAQVRDATRARRAASAPPAAPKLRQQYACGVQLRFVCRHAWEGEERGAHATLTPLQVTTLPNGMRIVTQDHPGACIPPSPPDWGVLGRPRPLALTIRPRHSLQARWRRST